MSAFARLPTEVKELIIEDLSKKELSSCVRVSSDFHALFLPFLWQQINITATSKRFLHKPERFEEGCAALAAHSSLVAELTLRGPLPDGFFNISFPNLKSLIIATGYSYPKPDLTVQHTSIIRANPTVQNLVLQLDSKMTSEFWQIIETEWIRPKSLTIEQILVEPSASTAFWRACSRFETLSINNDDIPFLTKGPDNQLVPAVDIFPNIERLTLSFVSGIYPSHVEWIRRCPRLVHLSWELTGRLSSVKSLANELVNTPWPNLSSLQIKHSSHGDEELAALIRHLPLTRTLDFFRSCFGPDSFSALKTHPDIKNLHSLSLLGCNYFTGAFAQSILEQCPVLHTFAAPFIDVQDVVSGGSQPWACSQTLRSLTIYVNCGRGSTITERHKMFQQLGLLTQLICLNLGAQHLSLLPSTMRAHITHDTTLSLRLTSDTGGLSNFAGLTRLRTFSFQETAQSLGMEEVQWIIDHWKNLNKVVGQFTNTGIPYSRLVERFLQHGIASKEFA